jgi:hypothetical protein
MGHIQSDDVDYVKSVITEYGFPALDARLKDDIFNPCVLLHSRPTLCMYAAAYNASRCLQYMWALDAKLHRDMKYTAISHFAITGNCGAILRFLLQNKISLMGAPQIAARFHQNQLFKWIVGLQCDVVELGINSGSCRLLARQKQIILSCFFFLISEGNDVNLTISRQNHQFLRDAYVRQTHAEHHSKSSTWCVWLI